MVKIVYVTPKNRNKWHEQSAKGVKTSYQNGSQSQQTRLKTLMEQYQKQKSKTAIEKEEK